MNETFSRIARKVSRATGSPWAAGLALLVVIAWIIAGIVFGFSDTMQLIINTGTTIVTFLMVFLIQASQNHDTDALNVKIDELLHAIGAADDTIAAAEEMSPDELEERLTEERKNRNERS